MKSKSEVFHRLEKLVARYRHKFVESTQVKLPCNCIYNHVIQQPISKESKIWYKAMSPRVQSTLIVLNNQTETRLCLYNSNDPAKWSGDVCDSEATSHDCPYFRPSRTRDAAFADFSTKLQDDDYVMNHHPDLATLQWVLGDRYWKINSSYYHRFLTALRSFKNVIRKAFSRRSSSDKVPRAEDTINS